MISTKALQSRRDIVEKSIQYGYFCSVALSPLGPAYHYSLWGICFLLLVYNVVFNKASFRLDGVSRQGWGVFYLLVALAVWVVFAGIFTFSNLHNYGRNVTPLIEVVFGAYLAMRTLREEKARRVFLAILVFASMFILIGNLLRLLKIIPFFPNRSLKNGNSLGALGLLLFPPLVSYAFWCVRDTIWLKLALIVTVCAIVVLSFSSGAWLSAFLGGLTFLYYVVRYKKLTLRFLAFSLVVFAICGMAFDFRTKGKFRRQLVSEFKQVQSIEDIDTFTTLRNQVWSATWYMIKEHPLVGSAGELFVDKNRWLMENKAKELGLTVKRDVDHPHSTYMNLLYIGGFPALALFVAAMLLCLHKSLVRAKHEKDAYFPWAVTCLCLLVEILTYATNGDVLRGRRDISVIVWCFFGVMALLPEAPRSVKVEK